MGLVVIALFSRSNAFPRRISGRTIAPKISSGRRHCRRKDSDFVISLFFLRFHSKYKSASAKARYPIIPVRLSEYRKK